MSNGGLHGFALLNGLIEVPINILMNLFTSSASSGLARIVRRNKRGSVRIRSGHIYTAVGGCCGDGMEISGGSRELEE